MFVMGKILRFALADTTLSIYPGSGLRLVVPWPVDPCDITEQKPC